MEDVGPVLSCVECAEYIRKGIMHQFSRQLKLTACEIRGWLCRFPKNATSIAGIRQKKGVRPGGRTGRQRSDNLEREER
ncbi:MAG: hypothetical protein CMO07_12135 [Thalassospira sp.]|nr:hypothetical protein [Thalassospira sp.]